MRDVGKRDHGPTPVFQHATESVQNCCRIAEVLEHIEHQDHVEFRALEGTHDVERIEISL